jgi:hypothetical protein
MQCGGMRFPGASGMRPIVGISRMVGSGSASLGMQIGMH